jgi:signal transduction histidine kinase
MAKLGEIGLAAAVAHEVRRLLTPARGYAELALESEGLTPHARKALLSLLHAASETESVLGALTVPRADTSNAAVGDVVSTMDGVDVAISPYCDVQVSPARLGIIIQNLVQNGRRAQRDSGNITVRAHRSTGNTVLIQVEDNGVGMTSEQAAAATQPFVSFNASSGMGLAICRYLVEEAGGTLRIASKAGHGTCVSVELPAAEAADKAKAA